VTVCDVIEHLHASPRGMLAGTIELLRDDGWLVVSVPNALNLRKRIDVVRGRTNYPPYDQFFRSVDGWRGHVREYAWSDLVQLARFLGLVDASVDGRHHMLGRLPAWMRIPYLATTSAFPAMRDTLTLCARKPRSWTLPPLP